MPPDKTNRVDVLGVGTNAHATDKAVLPPDNTKVDRLHHMRADHRSGFDWGLGEHRSARPSTEAKNYATKINASSPGQGKIGQLVPKSTS